MQTLPSLNLFNHRIKLIASILQVCLILLLNVIFPNDVFGIDSSKNASINSVKVDYHYPKYYIRWTATNLKEDGMFLIQELENGVDGFKTIHYKVAIGVEYTGPLLYCVTLVDSSWDKSAFRIKYRNTKGDTLYSETSVVTINEKSLPQPCGYVKVKVTRDSLYDEVAIVLKDNSIETSTEIVKRKLFQDPENPAIYLKSGTDLLCLKALPPLADSIVPIYFEHNTGGIFTMSIENKLDEPNLHIYLKNEKTKQLVEVTKKKHLELYVKSKNSGKKPAFSMVFSSNPDLALKKQKKHKRNWKRHYSILSTGI